MDSTRSYVNHMTTKQNNNWLIPAFLLMLGALNILFGALQLNMIQQGPPDVPDEFTSMHYFETPLPIVLHIVTGIIFNLLSPFQFAPAIWRHWPAWHRWSGRLLIVCGLLMALTGLWMNQFFPAFGGFLKYSGVVANSVGLIVSLGIAFRAILNRNIQHHRAWMMSAVAFGLAPATQRLFILPIFFLYGEVSEHMIGLIIWLGLLLNLSVVGWVLSHKRSRGLGQKSWQFNIALKEAL